MTSYLANLFLSLEATLSGLTDSGGNPLFRYVDQDLGQLDSLKPDGRPAVLFPCALVDIAAMHYEPVSDNVQTAKGRVVIRIGFPPLSATSAATTETYKEKALNYYEMEQAVHLALQGVVPALLVGTTDVLSGIFGHLERIAAETQRRRDGLRVRELIYAIAYDDYSAKRSPGLTTATLGLTVE